MVCGLCLLVGYAALSAWLYPSYPPSAAGTIRQKMDAYAPLRDQIDVVWVGDSRTFCAMHPEVYDPLLGRRSRNLSNWAHWFPTQLSQFEDLSAELPRDATVVWSIGHLNFPERHEGLEINREVYPLGLANALRLRSWGMPFAKLRPNLLFFNPATQVMSRGPLARRMIDEALAVEVWRGPAPEAAPSPEPAPATSPSPPPAPAATPAATPAASPAPVTSHARPSVAPVISRSPPSEAEVQRRLQELAQDPSFARTLVRRVDGKATSIESFRGGGGYWRIELDEGFFRAKQQAARAKHEPGDPPAPDAPVSPPYWQAFLAILDLCQARGVRLIVNELEEAPHQYQSRAHQLAYRAFMRERVEPEVTRRGFVYLRADLDQLEDRHYFDYNHLNSRGVLAYARLLAPLLRQHLPPRD